MINWVLIAFCLASSVTPVLLILLFFYVDSHFEEMIHRLHTIQMQLEPKCEADDV